MRSVCVIILAAVLIAPFTLRGQEPKKPQTPTTFVEVPPTQSRINWAHDNGRSEAHHLPETCGGGGVFFDYDNDDWMDIYLVNSGPSDFYSPGKPLKSALYHNNHDGTFTEVTDKAGVAANIFGMGAAASDYDGDGWVDLYVTGYDRSILYHNNSDGTFTDMTDKAGVAAPGWSTSAAWFDYDNDGKLDLFVSSFVEYSAKGTIFCGDNRLGRRYYCVPRVFKPRPSHLYHNEGNGKFKDVSRESGIANSLGKSFGVVATDVNNDGLLDLFVANDTVANFLFQNKGNGKFEEIGLAAGVAYSDSGSPRSGMGVDAADFDGDGWQDLFVANIDQELFSLYQNQHDLTFLDKPGEIGKATRLLSGWGLKFFDYDNDGSPDLILANGHPDDMVEIQSLKVKYKEPLLMFQNVKGTFKDVSSQSGAAFGKDWPARGLALGDYDNDGDLDVLIINNGEAPVLLKNERGNNNNWVGLQLAATKSNPAAVGAIITWEAGGVKYRRLKTSGGSFLATHDPREILGIGKAEKIDSVEIKWPSGRVDKLTNLPLNKYVKVVEGEGKWQPYKM
jgi:hypothetical protein